MADYYSWLDDDNGYNGLARMVPGTETSSSVWAYASATLNEWVVDPSLLGRILDGETDFVPITQERAAELADRYGVELDAPAEHRWDVAEQAVVGLSR